MVRVGRVTVDKTVPIGHWFLLWLGLLGVWTAVVASACGDAVLEVRGVVLTLSAAGSSESSTIEVLHVRAVDEIPSFPGTLPISGAEAKLSVFLDSEGRETNESYTIPLPLKTDSGGLFQYTHIYTPEIFNRSRTFRIEITRDGYEPATGLFSMSESGYTFLVLLRPMK